MNPKSEDLPVKLIEGSAIAFIISVEAKICWFYIRGNGCNEELKARFGIDRINGIAAIPIPFDFSNSSQLKFV